MGEFFTYGLLFVSLFFEVFMLVSFIDGRIRASRAPKTAPSTTALPSVAIMVPCYNEAATVAGTLRSLLALDYPSNLMEIIVVNDGSTDNTLEIVRAFESDPRVRVFSKANGGKHTAMNFGLTKTSAELIGCLDADSFVAPDALVRVAPLFADARIGAVTPAILVRDPQTMLQHMQNVEYRISLFVRYVLSSLGSAYITPGPFSIFRASIVRETGGWREAHMTEDLELALRIQEKGFLIANAPAAVVHTSTPPTVRKLIHQRIRWTYGFLRNAVDYRHMLGNRAYGNLGLLILPAAVISIAAALYFFFKILVGVGASVYHEYIWIRSTGLYPTPSFDIFFFNTSIMLFLVVASLILIVALIAVGSQIGTGRRTPPLATPLFLFAYGFLVPVWLGASVIRAALRTGVRWR